MLFLVFVALLVALLVVLAFSKRFAIGAFFILPLLQLKTFGRATLILASVFGVAGQTAGGGLFTFPKLSTSLRLVTLDETKQAGLQKRAVVAPLGLTAKGYQAKSISILLLKNDMAELREQIKYEFRRGNITAEKAATLSVLIDKISLEGNVAKANAPDSQVVALNTAQAFADLTQSQARLNETLADTTKLVKVLGSVRSPEFAGTFIAAKIQIVRLLVEKAAVDGSIDEIRQGMKRSKAG